MKLQLALIVLCLPWVFPAQAAGTKKGKPVSPKATAVKPSAGECQRYVEHLVELESADFAASDPEMQALSAAEQAKQLALIRTEAAKLPELAGELADCKAGKITRAELECSLKAANAAAADLCIGQ